MLIELDIDAFIAQKSEFDLLIDARSPKEFYESHIANAQNFYALSDEEHQEVGTLYKQVSRNDAKLLGARYICQNVAHHLEHIAKSYKIGSKIGIYCARGGLRSSSIAIILSHIGYQVFRLGGGYKQYRFYVLSYLENLPHYRFIVLGGNTGCGKSELLQSLQPSIDLEKLANHLGSSFGSIKGAQPSQKAFENSLCEILCKIDPNAYIFIEAESKKMGTCTIPALLHVRLLQGYRIEITAPLEQRIERILKEYESMTPAFFNQAMQMIAPYIKKTVKEAVLHAYEEGNLSEVAKILLIEYYDLVYKKPRHIDAILDNADESATLEALNALHVKLSTV
ncbi:MULTISPECIES: tRNA 2-selenouridine(34) synthase MnmH [unclassified Sulfurospirillum]|uniref:tRNA 2-selenouridine(34) synthase MnmH n=1 Tax=unclassified Sulfurospirillum TaxID=2618290 RepID=UPI0005040928|nr:MULTISPECIES: tRNA 2-selenouridine(34) synthase MnmH [unclassified Sulfurospirillum]KFL35211.1 tRNA 2-selenouridine synthase [Sulfurospirillum sp. SCADC]